MTRRDHAQAASASSGMLRPPTFRPSCSQLDGEERTIPSHSGPPLTRRALLALAGSTAVTQAASSRIGDIPLGQVPPAAVDPVVECWQQFLQTLAAREHATVARDRMEAELLQTVGYPRVQLPARKSEPAQFAAEVSDIDRALEHRRPQLRRRLKQELRQAQLAWEQAAGATGLPDASEAEDMACIAVQAALDQLLDTPATSLAGIRYKLAAIIAVGQPGPVEALCFPWLPLRRTLDDLARLREPATHRAKPPSDS